MAKISVLGSGGWGTAIAVMLDKNGHDVTLWSFFKEESEELRKYRENKKFLPGISLNDSIKLTSDISDCKNSDIIVMASPSHAVRNTARILSEIAEDGQIVLNIAKGIEEDTYKTMSEVIKEEIPNCVIAVMSGPSHAEEVSRGIPTTNTIASEKISVAEYIQEVFMNPVFRVYTNSDIKGVELGGSLKNVVALCCGILDGMGLGDNTKAALMTRGLVEMKRLGVSLGAKSETFNGLSGVGDLIVTCTSVHSRNRRAGILIGQGKSLEEAQKEVGMVVEGVKTCRAAKDLSDKIGVEMPIINEAYNVLFNGVDVNTALANLMGRLRKNETEDDFLHIV